MPGRSAPPRVIHITRDDPSFYTLLGPLFGSRAVARELGSPLWDDPGKEWLVAMHGRQVIGVCAWLPGARGTRLLSAYVLPEFRCQGVYAALFSERLRLVGDVCLTATVTPASLGTFVRYGFEVAGRKGRYTHVSRKS